MKYINRRAKYVNKRTVAIVLAVILLLVLATVVAASFSGCPASYVWSC